MLLALPALAAAHLSKALQLTKIRVAAERNLLEAKQEYLNPIKMHRTEVPVSRESVATDRKCQRLMQEDIQHTAVAEEMDTMAAVADLVLRLPTVCLLRVAEAEVAM